ncbi:MAG: hypothetical protein KatS3mg111_4266 [Pirellulaceae bacterium]|nr:MAG: hypothetical protein KatS3mg111_4266 [Pirellulaceae bacterium]
MYSSQVFTVLVALALAWVVPRAAGVTEAASAPEIVDEWVQWVTNPWKLDGPFEFVVAHPSGKGGARQQWRGSFFQNGLYECYVFKLEDSNAEWDHAKIANPDYSASLEKSSDGIWILEEVALRSTAEVVESDSPDVGFKTYVLDTIHRANLEWEYDEQTHTLHGQASKTFVDSLPEGKNYVKSAIVEVRSDYPHLPVRVEYVYGGGLAPDFKMIRHIEGWHPVGDDWMFRSLREKHYLAGQKPIEYERFKLIADPTGSFDTKRCYLSYYGLTEPEGLDKPNWWVWIALAIVLAVVGGLLVKRARR